MDWTPLLERRERFEAAGYGYSFGSKRVDMGPGFLNLKVMCRCLARALLRHLRFSKGTHLFLEDLKLSEADEDVEFSYKFGNDLRIERYAYQQAEEDTEDKEEGPVCSFQTFEEQFFRQRKRKPSCNQITFGAGQSNEQKNDDIEEDLERDEDNQYQDERVSYLSQLYTISL